MSRARKAPLTFRTLADVVDEVEAEFCKSQALAHLKAARSDLIRAAQLHSADTELNPSMKACLKATTAIAAAQRALGHVPPRTLISPKGNRADPDESPGEPR